MHVAKVDIGPVFWGTKTANYLKTASDSFGRRLETKYCFFPSMTLKVRSLALVCLFSCLLIWKDIIARYRLHSVLFLRATDLGTDIVHP